MTVISASFECKNGHRNELKWTVFPERDNPTARLIVEQETFARAYASKCPCGASAKDTPKVRIKD
jgi:hypothetical protein